MIQLNFYLKDKIINYKIISHIYWSVLKKCLDENPESCCDYLNKITRGLILIIKMMYSIDIRDEAGLLWPIIYVVRICGIIIEAINLLRSTENL